MLKDLSPAELKTYRQVQTALMYSRINKIANANSARDWERYRKEQHARATDQHTANEVTVK